GTTSLSAGSFLNDREGDFTLTRWFSVSESPEGPPLLRGESSGGRVTPRLGASLEYWSTAIGLITKCLIEILYYINIHSLMLYKFWSELIHLEFFGRFYQIPLLRQTTYQQVVTNLTNYYRMNRFLMYYCLCKRQQNVTHRTSIQNDNPWKLQQVQDAGNHLQQAILHIENIDKDYIFKSSEEVLHVLEDLAISFYIQSHKLIFAVYQLSNVHGTMKFDTHQAECSIPWLNEVLVLFTVALQLCQQLKDKICVFSQYKDFSIGSRSQSALSW
ncbi:hypothetical protein L9F63_001744, partial [Diploptera punctata]